MNTRRRALFAVAATVWLAACGPDEPVAEAPKPEVAAPQVLIDSADPAAKMAKAVSTAKTGAAVELRYEILAKPAVGVPFDVEVALVAGSDAEAMTVVIAGMPGLSVTGEVLPPLVDVKAGQVTSHRFTALAEQAGVYYISVTTTTLLAGTTLARTFSIPVLLGDAKAVQKATVAPKVDASGQAIESMPAQESSR